jgi:hypothetical protein
METKTGYVLSQGLIMSLLFSYFSGADPYRDWCGSGSSQIIKLYGLVIIKVIGCGWDTVLLTVLHSFYAFQNLIRVRIRIFI